MATKYKVKNTNKNSTEARMIKEEPLVGRGKILLLLIFGTLVIAGVYIVAISVQFAPIFHIYWILTAILFCVYLYLKQRRDLFYQKASDTEKLDEKFLISDRKRRKQLKYLLLVLLPFLFTIIGDAIYLFYLQDLNLVQSIKNLFGA